MHRPRRLVPGRAVTHRDHVRDRRCSALVTHHPAKNVQGAAGSHSTPGIAPMPTTTTSAAEFDALGQLHRGDPVGTRQAGHPDAAQQARAVRVRAAGHAAPSRSPSGPASGVGAASTTVTSSPNLIAVEATSAPMKPAPITTRRAPGCSSARSATASSTVRSTCTPARSAAPGHAGPRPGGHHDAVGDDRGPVLESHGRAAAASSRARVRPEQPRRLQVLGVGFQRQRPRRCRRPGTPSTAAAVVRPPGLAADHGQLAVEALRAQRPGGGQSGQ